MISNKRQIWLFWGCPKHNYVSQTNQLKACSNLMPFIKVEVYSIWKEWFLPFEGKRNNWCETVSWAWLAHNLGTEGEKDFQSIPRSNYYVPPKKSFKQYLTSIQNIHLISCFHLKRNVNFQWSSREKWWMWLVSSPLITNLLGIKNEIMRAGTIAILVGLWHFVTEKNLDASHLK